jgi:hypothetical protein
MLITLDQALEIASQLPIEQQDMLIEILQRRRIELRRAEIATAATAAIADFHSGKLKPQPVDEIIHELRQSLLNDSES